MITGDAKTALDSAKAADAFNPNNHPGCNGKIYQCADGKDNDADKLIDAMDPECTGPCDNDESSLLLDIPGVNMDPCKQDCYWDQNSGGGNDKCEWTHKCDPENPGGNLKPKCVYDPTYTKCPKAQVPQCIKFCLPLTPNGCDCFGCCYIYTNGKPSKKPVFLGTGATCTVKTPQNCNTCTQVKGCTNACGKCEICLGKKLSDLPKECFPTKADAGTKPKDAGTKPKDAGTKPKDVGGSTSDNGFPTLDMGTSPGDGGGGTPMCPPGLKTCITNAQCPLDHYCITGCCIRTVQ